MKLTIMKKIIDFIVGMLLAIVYPNRILNIFKVRNLDQNSNKILGNDNVVKVLAFVAAIVFVIIARYTPGIADAQQQTLPNIQLEVLIDEGYTYWGSPIPSHVDIILRGDSIDITLQVASGVSAYLDLRGLEPGQHDDVIINVDGVIGQLTYVVNPTTTISDITIDEIETAEFLVHPITVLPDLDSRYSYSEIRIEPEYVTVIGPSRLLEQIYKVLTTFDTSDMPTTPAIISRPGLLVANDEGIDVVRGVEFDPTTINVLVEIYEDTVPISIEVNENLINLPRSQYNVISVTSDIDEIQVWGDYDDLESAIELPRISFTALNDEGQITFPIELPEGVYTEIEGETVSVVEIVVTVVYEELPTEPEDDEDEDNEDDEDDDEG